MVGSINVGLVCLFLILLTLACAPDDVMIGSGLNYYCASKNIFVDCVNGISSTKTRCYYDSINRLRYQVCSDGWKVVEENKYECGDYFCYSDKDYCRLHGLVTNPKIDKVLVCG